MISLERVEDAITALERIAAALERIADASGSKCDAYFTDSLTARLARCVLPAGHPGHHDYELRR